jgi:hypothetical protein
MNMENWEAFGDVNPFEHGGGWLRKVGERQFEVVYIEEQLRVDYCSVEVLHVDLTDSWIEHTAVSECCGWSDNHMTDADRAVDVIRYYGSINFGGSQYVDMLDIELEAKPLVRKITGIAVD